MLNTHTDAMPNSCTDCARGVPQLHCTGFLAPRKAGHSLFPTHLGMRAVPYSQRDILDLAPQAWCKPDCCAVARRGVGANGTQEQSSPCCLLRVGGCSEHHRNCPNKVCTMARGSASLADHVGRTPPQARSTLASMLTSVLRSH